MLGGVDWTVNVAGDFILNLLGGLVRDLIPRSWIDKGLDIMTWLVAVPDYTARVTTPGRRPAATASPASTPCAACTRGWAWRSRR